MIRIAALFSFTICILTFLPTPSAIAKGSVKIGDTIPHDLILLDQTRKKRNFDDLKGKKGIVLVFVRSIEWCPFCQKQLLDLNKNENKFKKEGYPIVTISYDSVLAMNKFLTKHKPSITILSDPRSESIRAFGILNESPAMGTRSYGIPHPGVYIIDNRKKIQGKFFKKEYKERPSTKEILAKIKELNPPPKQVTQYKSLDEMGQDPIIPGNDIIEIPEETLAPVLPPLNTDIKANELVFEEEILQ